MQSRVPLPHRSTMDEFNDRIGGECCNADYFIAIGRGPRRPAMPRWQAPVSTFQPKSVFPCTVVACHVTLRRPTSGSGNTRPLWPTTGRSGTISAVIIDEVHAWQSPRCGTGGGRHSSDGSVDKSDVNRARRHRATPCVRRYCKRIRSGLAGTGRIINSGRRDALANASA